MVEQSGDSVDPTGFQVGNHQVDGAVVLSVSGEVDMLSAPRLAEAIHTALAASPTALIVDLSKVDFLASAGMTVLVAAPCATTANRVGGTTLSCAATSRPIQLTKLDSVLPLYSTLDNALESVAGG
jgi:anti-anti-sigma factor